MVVEDLTAEKVAVTAFEVAVAVVVRAQTQVRAQEMVIVARVQAQAVVEKVRVVALQVQ